MTVRLSNYNPDWAKMFEQEMQLIAANFPIKDFLMEHVGSTAVKDLKAKPVIDIMVGVPSLPEDITPTVNHLQTFGYQYIEEYNLIIPERRFFQKDKSGIRTHQIHMVSFYSDFWNRLIFFRNQLRDNLVIKQQYQKLKEELAKRSWNSVNDYANAKTDFINSIEQQRPTRQVRSMTDKQAK